jgi:hypothetical protein
MQKWADYLISAVKTATGSSTAEAFEVHSDFGSMVCETAVEKRAEVVANLKHGVTYSTVFKTAMGKWRKGNDVHLVTINGQDYLRTNNTLVARDQFDEVPEF